MMSLIKEARRYAEHAHSGQMRKLSDTPYIVHPINVGNILEKAGFSEEVIAAAYLHDAVEDTSVTLEEMVQRIHQQIRCKRIGTKPNSKLFLYVQTRSK